MKAKKFKEEFENDFKSGMHSFGIHSVGDLFKFGFKGALKVFELLFKWMS